jgi:hypothetical protein
MPLGQCKEIRNLNTYSGCIYELENTINSGLAPPCSFMIGGSAIQLIGIISSCCFCWKRKTHDTFPDLLTNIPWDPYKNSKVDPALILESQLHEPKYLKAGIEFVDEQGLAL